MSIYNDYIKQIEERKDLGLSPLPIDGADLLSAIIDQIKEKQKECNTWWNSYKTDLQEFVKNKAI